jgi:hypothetical protein
MPSHFALMIVFALLASSVLAGIIWATPGERFRYGARMFAVFVVTGLVVAWLMYPLSH